MLRRGVLSLVGLVVSMALGVAPALASETHVFSSSFGSAGAGAGQVSLAGDSGVAVNASTHDVYVADTGNARVDEFSASGEFLRAWGWGVADGLPALETCTLSCQKGLEGSGEGQFTTPVFVAVDNSGGASAGDVYVGDRGQNAVLKFTGEGAYLATNNGAGATSPVAGPFGALAGVTVDGSGSVWVYDEAGDMFGFAQDGSFATDWNSGRGVTANGIDVDSAGNLYVLTAGGNVEQFTAAGTDVGSVNGDAFGPLGVAVDRSGDDVYMNNGGSAIRHYAASCDAGGNCAASDFFGEGQLNGGAGVAVDPSSQIVYAADVGGARVDMFAPVTLPDVSTGGVSGVAQSAATLEGTVDANGTAISDCHFSYVDEADYAPGASDPYAAGSSAPCAITPSGVTPQPVSAGVTGLTPGTVYHFRLSAANSGGTVTGQDQVFTTGPTIGLSYATDVTSSSVSLHAQINPRGLATTYHFDYGATPGYGHSTPESASIGSDGEDHTVTVHVQGLEAGTVYHYRVVATNAIASSGLAGPDRTITTQAATTGGVALPDGRGYELVTPPSKGDGIVSPYLQIGGIQTSVSGDALAYQPTTPFPEATTGLNNEYLARRGAGGWSSRDLTPPQAPENQATGIAPFMSFSSDLGSAVIEDGGRSVDSPPLVSGEPQGAGANLFVRDNFSNAYQLANMTPEGVTPSEAFLLYEGASPDGKRVLFASRAPLVPGAVEGVENLYQWSGGAVSLLGLVPPGSATRCGPEGPACVVPQNGAEAGMADTSATEAKIVGTISRDGSEVLFREGGGTSTSQLFVREGGERTVEVSASQKTNGSGPGGRDPAGPRFPRYWPMSSDGSKVLFTSCEQLTNDSTANSSELSVFCHSSINHSAGNAIMGSDLYAFDTASGTLSDLSVDHNGDPFGADVQSVLGSSGDGSYVYFVANGVLAPGARPGDCREGFHDGRREQCNVYLWHDGTTTFIARIDDDSDGGGLEGWRGYAATARVTPDGKRLAFETTASLTGYDNLITDGSSACGTAFPEIKNFDAIAGPSATESCSEVYLYDADVNSLRCASCNPTGARPVGASALSGIEQPGSTDGVEFEYLPRSLSADGSRLFFESEDALVPGDVNGKVDLYEYEDGHVYLISSGTSAEDSRFMDASADGRDVFFSTFSRLVGQDIDESRDIYDARVGGGFPFTPPRELCSGEACKAPAAVASPGPAPVSGGAAGAGNLAPVPTSPGKVASRTVTRAQRLAAALKACARKPRRKRASCKARARKLYGPVGAGRSTKSAGKGGK
jgi:hypothetical protein